MRNGNGNGENHLPLAPNATPTDDSVVSPSSVTTPKSDLHSSDDVSTSASSPVEPGNKPENLKEENYSKSSDDFGLSQYWVFFDGIVSKDLQNPELKKLNAAVSESLVDLTKRLVSSPFRYNMKVDDTAIYDVTTYYTIRERKLYRHVSIGSKKLNEIPVTDKATLTSYNDEKVLFKIFVKARKLYDEKRLKLREKSWEPRLIESTESKLRDLKERLVSIDSQAELSNERLIALIKGLRKLLDSLSKSHEEFMSIKEEINSPSLVASFQTLKGMITSKIKDLEEQRNTAEFLPSHNAQPVKQFSPRVAVADSRKNNQQDPNFNDKSTVSKAYTLSNIPVDQLSDAALLLHNKIKERLLTRLKIELKNLEESQKTPDNNAEAVRPVDSNSKEQAECAIRILEGNKQEIIENQKKLIDLRKKANELESNSKPTSDVAVNDRGSGAQESGPKVETRGRISGSQQSQSNTPNAAFAATFIGLLGITANLPWYLKPVIVLSAFFYAMKSNTSPEEKKDSKVASMSGSVGPALSENAESSASAVVVASAGISVSSNSQSLFSAAVTLPPALRRKEVEGDESRGVEAKSSPVKTDP